MMQLKRKRRKRKKNDAALIGWIALTMSPRIISGSKFSALNGSSSISSSALSAEWTSTELVVGRASTEGSCSVVASDFPKSDLRAGVAGCVWIEGTGPASMSAAFRLKRTADWEKKIKIKYGKVADHMIKGSKEFVAHKGSKAPLDSFGWSRFSGISRHPEMREVPSFSCPQGHCYYVSTASGSCKEQVQKGAEITGKHRSLQEGKLNDTAMRGIPHKFN